MQSSFPPGGNDTSTGLPHEPNTEPPDVIEVIASTDGEHSAIEASTASTHQFSDCPRSRPEKNRDLKYETQLYTSQNKAKQHLPTGPASYVMFSFIILVFLVNSLQAQTSYALTPYVVSEFESHSLLSIITIVTSLLSGVLQIPAAKTLDIWGRAEGFAVMVVISMLGNILMAVCENIQTYFIAQCFSYVGANGMMYALTVVVADSSAMENKGIAFALVNFPYLATSFAGPALAQEIFDTIGFRWFFGLFAMIMPVLSLPVSGLLFCCQRKAKKQGLTCRPESERSIFQSLTHYFVEFDAVGVLLGFIALTLFLLPFSLTGPAGHAWDSPVTVIMLVVGTGLLAAFTMWESFSARSPYVPFHLLKTPSIMGAALATGSLFGAYYCWEGYFTSYLQVVRGLDIAESGYIGNIYNTAGTGWALLIGILIKVSGHYKWLGYASLALLAVGGAMMLLFRQADTGTGSIVMCQIFVSLGGGSLYICGQMAALAVAEQEQTAAIVALMYLASAIGGGVGGALAGAIWSNTVPQELTRLLPDESREMVAEIYGNLDGQLEYGFESPIRSALIEAYSIAQFRLCLAATAILVIAFIGVVMWKDVSVKKTEQAEGGVVS
ncbi:major facilitator superfamily domain-containing protein [Amylocarpus encephaloides]|uniref:Major facilitator superfamily domain-containing protein n=1 Tax=Amylocarpus encephaloides TaxID=45428 RepID=A0A9P7YHD6_9HELO|nr:major facilitator superfamily domain-containing protein [Amylocarpus encephaloides]